MLTVHTDTTSDAGAPLPKAFWVDLLTPTADEIAQVAADFATLADALAAVPLGDLGPFQAAAE